MKKIRSFATITFMTGACIAGFGYQSNAAQIIPTTDTTISAPLTGDDGGPAPADSAGITGNAPVLFGAGNITITNQSTLTGGNGSNAGVVVSEPNYLNGGIGGVGVAFNGQSGLSAAAPVVFINTQSGVIKGGTGGIGANSFDPGTGGTGGYGVHVGTTNALFKNYGSITGGTGGTVSSSIMSGGAGGSGVYLSGTNIVFDNYGTVNGGAGGDGGTLGYAGSGGTGIEGSGTNIVVNNYGTINSGAASTVPTATQAGYAVSLAGTLNNFGTITGVVSCFGALAINNSSIINGNITCGSGNDTITQNAGSITSTTIVLGLGTNTVNMNGGTMSGNITGGTAQDTLNVTAGTYTGNVNLNNGNNFFNISGGVINGNLTGGTGADTFVLSGGTVNGNTSLGNGSNSFTLTGGTLNGTLTMGAGNDTLILGNGGTITGIINLGAGSNTVSVTGNFTVPAGFLITTATPYTVASGGTLSFASSFYLNGNLTVNTGGRVNVSDNLSDVFALENDGTIFINAGKTLNAGYLSGANSGNYIFEVNSAASAGLIALTNAINLTGTHISVQTAQAPSLSNNDQILIMSGVGALTGFANTTGQTLASVTDNSYLWDFSIADGSQPQVTAGSNANLYLLVSQVHSLSGSADVKNIPVAQAFQPLLSNSVDPQIVAVKTQINAAGSANALNSVLSSLQPSTDNSLNLLSNMISDRVMSQISDRMGQLHQSDNIMPQSHFQASVAALSHINSEPVDVTDDKNAFGKAIQKLAYGIETQPAVFAGANSGLWARAFGSGINQDKSGNIAGFDADVYGATIGIDHKISPTNLLGMAVSFADSNVNSQDINRTGSDIKTYHVSLYSDNYITDDVYLNGAVSYGWNDIESVRYNVGGVPLTARANYTNQQFGGTATLGKEIHLQSDLMLNISGISNYIYAEGNNYTEYGAGGAGLHVSNDATQLFELGMSAEISYDFKNESGSFIRPHANAGYRYDLIGDGVTSTASFIAGSAAFRAQGPDAQRSTVNAGMGVDYFTTENMNFGARYDYELKNEYSANSVQATARWEF